MNRLTAAAAAAWIGLVSCAMAQEAARSPVVVELFTSQGCSSCPPADALITELAEREDVIPLALHVDYWDYIGWADTFADPAFSMRQRAYAAAAGARSVYTPQMVVNGKDHLIGAKPMELAELIRKHAGGKTPVTLRVTRDGQTLHIRITAEPPLAKGALVQLVRYRPEAVVDIRRGENAGRSLVYANIVESWKPLAEWDGRSEMSIDSEVSGSRPAVVIVQEAGPGPILAAARLR